MNRSELAARLIEADSAACEKLLQENSSSLDAALAYALKEICYESWTTAPARARRTAEILEAISRASADDEIRAVAAWVQAIAALTVGQLESAIKFLDAAERIFKTLGKERDAAATQVSKLYALAMLGRYDEAIECGARALQVFQNHHDTLAAAKIAHNMGNIYWRRDRYTEAENHLRSARACFLEIGDEKQLAMIENCLAYIRSLRHDFRDAERLYALALGRASCRE